jgi:hypothetical protein
MYDREGREKELDNPAVDIALPRLRTVVFGTTTSTFPCLCAELAENASSSGSCGVADMDELDRLKMFDILTRYNASYNSSTQVANPAAPNGVRSNQFPGV